MTDTKIVHAAVVLSSLAACGGELAPVTDLRAAALGPWLFPVTTAVGGSSWTEPVFLSCPPSTSCRFRALSSNARLLVEPNAAGERILELPPLDFSEFPIEVTPDGSGNTHVSVIEEVTGAVVDVPYTACFVCEEVTPRRVATHVSLSTTMSGDHTITAFSDGQKTVVHFSQYGAALVHSARHALNLDLVSVVRGQVGTNPYADVFVAGSTSAGNVLYRITEQGAAVIWGPSTTFAITALAVGDENGDGFGDLLVAFERVSDGAALVYVSYTGASITHRTYGPSLDGRFTALAIGEVGTSGTRIFAARQQGNLSRIESTAHADFEGAATIYGPNPYHEVRSIAVGTRGSGTTRLYTAFRHVSGSSSVYESTSAGNIGSLWQATGPELEITSLTAGGTGASNPAVFVAKIADDGRVTVDASTHESDPYPVYVGDIW
ncbi:MAG: VCBS repeat-containing protein [Deltaproteobacteria bacterium]